MYSYLVRSVLRFIHSSGISFMGAFYLYMNMYVSALVRIGALGMYEYIDSIFRFTFCVYGNIFCFLLRSGHHPPFSCSYIYEWIFRFCSDEFTEVYECVIYRYFCMNSFSFCFVSITSPSSPSWIHSSATISGCQYGVSLDNYFYIDISIDWYRFV